MLYRNFLPLPPNIRHICHPFASNPSQGIGGIDSTVMEFALAINGESNWAAQEIIEDGGYIGGRCW